MDERVARLRTSTDAKRFAENAARANRPDLQEEALRRAHELRAIEDGHQTPATQAIAQALYAYEEQQSHLKARKGYRANYTRRLLRDLGAIGTAEHMVFKPQASIGFEVLEEAGMQSMSFEAIIDRYPEEFSSDAVEAARARLRGLPLPMHLRKRRPKVEKSAPEEPIAPSLPVFDAEALSFLEGFSDPDAWYLNLWLPRYRNTTKFIAEVLSTGHPEQAFDLIWKRADNSVSNAGQGILKFEVVESIRDDLIAVIRDVHADGSPENFQAIVERFEGWKASGRIPMVPRLLIARAFAGIHPGLYHSTVDAASQADVIEWFAQHTRFRIPRSKDWAVGARALVDHLDRAGLFGDDVLSRNMFPWFVIVQLRARHAPSAIPPGHTPRPASAFADLSPGKREIMLRHNVVQTILFNQLSAEFGPDRVWTECPTGTGGYADALVRPQGENCYLYEIKIAATCSQVVRESLGQLLEYGFRGGGLEPSKLFIVGEPRLDEVTQRFLDRLRADFKLEIAYLQVTVAE